MHIYIYIYRSIHANTLTGPHICICFLHTYPLACLNRDTHEHTDVNVYTHNVYACLLYIYICASIYIHVLIGLIINMCSCLQLVYQQ